MNQWEYNWAQYSNPAMIWTTKESGFNLWHGTDCFITTSRPSLSPLPPTLSFLLSTGNEGMKLATQCRGVRMRGAMP
jgi:hypothetical protein